MDDQKVELTPEQKEEKLKEIKEDSIPYNMPKQKPQPPQMDEETALSKMSPAQKEQLEKLKVIYEDKIAKMHFKANLRTMAQDKAAAKRKKAEKVNKKRNKASRRHK